MSLQTGHPHCADMPVRSLLVWARCCASCGGWTLQVDVREQADDDIAVIHGSTLALGPFDMPEDVRQHLAAMVAAAPLERLTPWADPGADPRAR